MKTKENQKKSEKDHIPNLLLSFGVRPTRQRLALASYLFDGEHKHVTADQVLSVARKRKIRVSLATVYNTLNQFTEVGLLREIAVNHTCSYFDTNVTAHYHFFDEVTGRLWDIPDGLIQTASLPKAPPGRKIKWVDMTIRLGKAS